LYTQHEKYVQDHEIRGITFTGFIEEDSLRWLYENCQAYIFPSLSEGFGLPPLEAMTYGAPVVSSNATCLPEVSGKAAHYFDPLNTKDMAKKIEEVLDNKTLRDELIKNGYAQIKKYSWEKMAKQTLEIYESVLKEKNLS
jgi:glycosyltransferase involved in cell wall biosynthesis